MAKNTICLWYDKDASTPVIRGDLPEDVSELD
jgi:hypothetical protein